MSRRRELTPAQRQRERALFYSLLADVLLTAFIALVALVSGSLTMGAEFIRASLMVALEVVSFVALWRIHRGRFVDFEFGHGKIEQLANIGIASAMLVGGVMVFSSAVSSLTGEPQPLSPFGLTLAACLAAVNICQNFLAWVAMRRAARVEANTILAAQLQARWVKLVSTFVVLLALTIAALTFDLVVAHWLDGCGAVFVAGLMVWSAIGMVRAGLPDLVDRGVGEATQLAILRALGRRFDDYACYRGMRTRSSAGRYFVEVDLGYPETLSLAESDRRQQALEDSLREELGECDVVVRVHGEPVSAGAEG